MNDDLHGINEFWGQTLVAIPAPTQAKLEMVDPEGTDTVSSGGWHVGGGVRGDLLPALY